MTPNDHKPSGKSLTAPGAKTAKTAWKPKSSSRPKAEVAPLSCPHCGVAIQADYAICPGCGHALTEGKCSFCGAPKKPEAKFCTSCGQSRDGVRCPECGTMNWRNFCRKCNHPLTPRALQAIETAKSDPKFKAVQKQADELARLHAEINSRLEHSDADQKPVLSEADRILLDEYSALLNCITGNNPTQTHHYADTAGRQDSRASMSPRPTEYADTSVSFDDLLEAYREKADEMNRALAEMVPPPDYTPEQQRDYYSARKVATVEHAYDMTDYTPVKWQCNYCGAIHNQPAECVAPELGGTWLYITPEEYIEACGSSIISSTSLKIN